MSMKWVKSKPISYDIVQDSISVDNQPVVSLKILESKKKIKKSTYKNLRLFIDVETRLYLWAYPTRNDHW